MVNSRSDINIYTNIGKLKCCGWRQYVLPRLNRLKNRNWDRNSIAQTYSNLLTFGSTDLRLSKNLCVLIAGESIVGNRWYGKSPGSGIERTKLIPENLPRGFVHNQFLRNRVVTQINSISHRGHSIHFQNFYIQQDFRTRLIVCFNNSLSDRNLIRSVSQRNRVQLWIGRDALYLHDTSN